MRVTLNTRAVTDRFKKWKLSISGHHYQWDGVLTVRNSEVDQNNPYYEQHYHNLSDEATVEDIGGTECQKCHY